MASGFRAPTQLHVNGYLTVNGAKMSKSRGTFVMARTYLDAGLNPEYLRYYFAAKSGGGVDDLDLNLEDFVARVNADLVGKFVNIASRCAGFIDKRFDGRAGRAPAGRRRMYDAIRRPMRCARSSAQPTSAGDFSRRRARGHGAGRRGQPLHRRAQALGHSPRTRTAPTPNCSAVCTQGLNLFRVLAAVPQADPAATSAQRAERFLGGAGQRLGTTSRAACRRTPSPPTSPCSPASTRSTSKP